MILFDSQGYLSCVHMHVCICVSEREREKERCVCACIEEIVKLFNKPCWFIYFTRWGWSKTCATGGG